MSEAAPTSERRRPWIALVLEDVLLDPRPGVLAIVEALSGATPADVAAFEATGEYADPWEIARAAGPWIRAGRPRPIPPGGWRVVVNQCGRDPGELRARAERLWRDRAWRAEAPRLDAGRLTRLSALANLVVVTSRDRRALSWGEERLGFQFPAATTSDDVLRPDAQVLLRHAASGHFVGRGALDRATATNARWVFHDAPESTVVVVDRILAKLDPPKAAAPAPAEEPAADDQGRSTVTSTSTSGTSTSATT